MTDEPEPEPAPPTPPADDATPDDGSPGDATPDGGPSDEATPPTTASRRCRSTPGSMRTLAGLGYEEPTPIQLAAIPPLLEGRDLLAEAPTGTGKTAAFALPILQRLAERLDADRLAGRPVEGRGVPTDGRGARPSSLVLAPTRELAMQVAEAIHRYGRELGVRVVPVYGGQPITTQLHRLGRGVDVVVATPGRAVDHLDRGTIRFDEVGMVVLDEADEMLDMGFADDLERILGGLPLTRQTALFSATIAGPIARLAEAHLRQPTRVRVQSERAAAGEPARVRQVAYVVRRADKLAALGRILDLEDGAATLVFARTRGEVDDLAEALSGRGRDAAALHGGLSQEQRDRIMGRFREGALDVLVATDVAARGLDIEHISHVVNYDVPSSPETYVHRIGRTGRAGREGVAITLVEPREHRLLRDIERTVGRPLQVEGLPTVSDMREHRLDALKAALRETLVAGGTDRYRAVVEALSGRVRPGRHRARGDQPGGRGGARRRGRDRAGARGAARPSTDRPGPSGAPAPARGPASRVRATRRGQREPAAGVRAPRRGRAAAARGARAQARRRGPRARHAARGPAQGLSGERLARHGRPARHEAAALGIGRARRRHAAVRRGGARGGHAARRPRRRDHQRGGAARRRHRRDPDRGRVLAGRGARGGGRPRDPDAPRARRSAARR